MTAVVLDRPAVVDDLTRRELIGSGLALGIRVWLAGTPPW